MRYDKEIRFIKEAETKYDPKTGNHEKTAQDTQIKCMASVIDASDKTIQIVYGELREGVLSIQLQNRMEEPFDYILIGSKRYKVDRKRNLRIKQTFIVSEMM